MRTHVKIYFYLLNSKKKSDGSLPIYVRITFLEEYLLISTGLSAYSREWNKKLKRMKGDSERSTLINQAISNIESEITAIANRLNESGKVFTVREIKELFLKKNFEKSPSYVSECFDFHIKYLRTLEGKEYASSTIQKYSITKERILQFIRMKYKKNDLLIGDINEVFLMDFDIFLRLTISNSPKTIQKHIQRFKTVLRFNEKRERIQIKRLHYTVQVPQKKVEFLTQNEVSLLESLELVSERLTIIRDLFIFSCYSGLSYTELKNLTKDDLKVINDEVWIYMIRQKTKREFKVPLLYKCVEIIKKYSNHKSIRKKKQLLPVPSNQRYNEYLKELNTITGISTPLTTHLARKTYACTVLLRNGVHIQIVSQLLGHSNTSITIKSYLSEVPELMMTEFEKVRKNYSNKD